MLLSTPEVRRGEPRTPVAKNVSPHSGVCAQQ